MNFSFLSVNLLKRDLKVYLLVLLFAAISWGLLQIFQVEYKIGEEVHEAPKHSADYFSSGYLRKDLNEKGLLKSELSAQSILHYSDDETTHIDKPKLTLYNSDPSIPPWIVRSEKGVLLADGEHLLLQGQVFIDKAATKGGRQISIKTTNLRVNPKTSYAEGDEWIEILSPPHRIEAKGVQMTFKKPIHINLLSHVKSRYVLNK